MKQLKDESADATKRTYRCSARSLMPDLETASKGTQTVKSPAERTPAALVPLKMHTPAQR